MLHTCSNPRRPWTIHILSLIKPFRRMWPGLSDGICGLNYVRPIRLRHAMMVILICNFKPKDRCFRQKRTVRKLYYFDFKNQFAFHEIRNKKEHFYVERFVFNGFPRTFSKESGVASEYLSII